jgi:photosystem II stability/assembly factor-like uncharacterized protein
VNRRCARRARWLAALAVMLPAAGAVPQPLAAEQAPLAAHSLLVAIAQAGQRVVAVGDRGIIVLSDDQGASWVQASRVPSQALLTGVCFLDAQHGVAVGHDEVILVTADAGRTWQRTHYAPEAQRPLLDVWCGSGGQVIAVGAYSAYLTSRDGGASWQEQKFSPAPLAAAHAPAGDAGAQEPPRNDYHLNRIVAASDTRLYIAAEAGHLYRSDDGGDSWRTLASPYAGSFFGVLPLGDTTLLAFGLRGNLYRSEDAGASWRRLESGTVAMLDGAAHAAGRAVVIVGLSGVLLASRDDGQTFTLLQQADHIGLAAVAATQGGALVAIGEDGARRTAAPP